MDGKQHGPRRDPQGSDGAYATYFANLEATAAMHFRLANDAPLAVRLRVRDTLMYRYVPYPAHLYAAGTSIRELRGQLDTIIDFMRTSTAFLRREGQQVEPGYGRTCPVRANGRSGFGMIALALLLTDSPRQLKRFTALIALDPCHRTYLADLFVQAFTRTPRIAKTYDDDRHNAAWTGPVLRALALPPAQRSAALAACMNGWCRTMRLWGWAPDPDQRPYPDNLFGDFAFEVALAVCAYDIDDAGFRDHPYYPADLVDHYRANLRRTRDAWRLEGAGAGVPIDAPPPPARADLGTSTRVGLARWLELVCDGDDEAVEGTLDVVGTPTKVKELDALLEAIGTAHALCADLKDDETVVDTLSAMAKARGFDGFAAPDGPPFGPARCTAALRAFAGWAGQRGSTALALDDDWDNWVAVLVRNGYVNEFRRLSAALGIVVREPEQAWSD